MYMYVACTVSATVPAANDAKQQQQRRRRRHRESEREGAAAPADARRLPAHHHHRTVLRTSHDVACREHVLVLVLVLPRQYASTGVTTVAWYPRSWTTGKLGIVGEAALLGGWNPQVPYLLKWTEGTRVVEDGAARCW